MASTTSYSFPSFYACYLLKSARNPRAYKNYIGSTPDPVRRLRQHNGELKDGARETSLHRPWIMHLLVHGFPSRPAATIFEFAWQNPHQTRFFRDSSGKRLFAQRGTRIIDNVLILQQLIRTHPFSTWPLHVKLFTEEAVQCWSELAYTSPLVPAHKIFQWDNPDGDNRAVGNEVPQDKEHQNQQLFPPGFTCSIELEGVDGRSGVRGSGRKEPVCITDKPFTSAYLAKHTALIASGHHLNCSVCATSIHDFPTNHLGTTLCTHTGCTSVSHLACLAQSWLETEHQTDPYTLQSLSTLSSPTSLSPSSHISPACSHPLGQVLPASGSAPPSSASLSSSTKSSQLLISPSASQPPSSSAQSPRAPLSDSLLAVLFPPSANSTSAANKSLSDITRNRRSTTAPKLKSGLLNPSRPSYTALASENSFPIGKSFLPRGGTCSFCGNYTLWGDIIKGCFRRHTGHENQVSDADEAAEDVRGIKGQKELEGLNSGLGFKRSHLRSGSGAETLPSAKQGISQASKRMTKTKTKGKTKASSGVKGTVKRKTKGKTKRDASTSAASISATSEQAAETKTKRQTTKKMKRSVIVSSSSTSGSSGASSTASTSMATLPSRKRGRPKKQKEGLTMEMELESSNVSEGILLPDQLPPIIINTDAPQRRGRPRKLTSAVVSGS